MATERELKFSTTDDHVPGTLELELALAGSGLSVGPGRVSRHVDLYHDVDGRLGGAGMALRLRRSSAGARVTLKADAQVLGGAAGNLHRRSELEVVIEDPPTEAGCRAVAWPELVLAALPPGLAVERLAPVAELHIRRVAFLISSAPGGSPEAPPFAELAFDEVTCMAPGTRTPGTSAQFHEVELEWLGGEEEPDSAAMANLAAVAEAVGSVVTLTASPVSKLDRALALLAALDDT